MPIRTPAWGAIDRPQQLRPPLGWRRRLKQIHLPRRIPRMRRAGWIQPRWARPRNAAVRWFSPAKAFSETRGHMCLRRRPWGDVGRPRLYLLLLLILVSERMSTAFQGLTFRLITSLILASRCRVAAVSTRSARRQAGSWVL